MFFLENKPICYKFASFLNKRIIHHYIKLKKNNTICLKFYLQLLGIFTFTLHGHVKREVAYRVQLKRISLLKDYKIIQSPASFILEAGLSLESTIFYLRTRVKRE